MYYSSCIIHLFSVFTKDGGLGGVVALSVEYRTRDQEVVGSSLGRARGVETLGMFLTPMCLCSLFTKQYIPAKGR